VTPTDWKEVCGILGLENATMALQGVPKDDINKVDVIDARRCLALLGVTKDLVWGQLHRLTVTFLQS